MGTKEASLQQDEETLRKFMLEAGFTEDQISIFIECIFDDDDN